ncbi:NACHT domain-containing protein [Catenulispora subtropica]
MRYKGVWISGVCVLGVVGAFAWLWQSALSRSSLGQVDPVSATISGASLVVSLVGLVATLRTARGEPDPAAGAKRLALEVREAESAARAQLLGGTRKIDVEFVLRPARNDASGAARKGSLADVTGYFRDLDPPRLIVTGNPGSGKTVAVIELILGLLADDAPGAPVPVRMSAASLDADGSVTDWLISHLREQYRLSKSGARALVRARMVLPIIDGLDETTADSQPGYASPAAEVLRACNTYLDGTDRGALVITCRNDQYTSLVDAGERLAEAAHVELKAVGLIAAKKYINGRVHDDTRWEPVLADLRRNGNKALATALSTPWRLALATTVYEQRDSETGRYKREPAELVDPALGSEEAIRNHLLDTYIAAAVAQHGGRASRYDERRTRRWLTTLARHLDATGSTDMMLDELWPLAGRRLPRLLAVIPALLLFALLGSAEGRFLVTGLAIVPAGAVLIWWISNGKWWPQPVRLDIGRLAKPMRALRSPADLVILLTAGVIAAVILPIVDSADFTYRGAAAATGVALPLLLIGSVSVVRLSDSGTIPARPVDRVQFAVTLWIVAAAFLMVLVVLGLWLSHSVNHSSVSHLVLAEMSVVTAVLFATIFTTTFAVLLAPQAVLYVAMLLCSRRWTKHPLPWRLNRFLSWSSEAGLLRTAGTSYQFRHKELQDYLAR